MQHVISHSLSLVLTMTSSEERPPLRLLALDGGGIRGLSELLIIKEVMHKLMFEENEKREKDGKEPLSALPKPCDYFDLIGGTSTGGIIALMLGRLRMDVDTALTQYDDLAKQVFSAMKPWPWGDGKFRATTLEAAMKSVVKNVTGDSESSLLEGDQARVCRTFTSFVCAKNAHNMEIPVLFRTYQSRETHLDCKIWEAARATSAAPTFFKRIIIGRDQPFIDGGLGRNNPSQVVLEEANALFGARQIGCLAGIIGIKKPGLWQRILPTDVIDALKAITTDCESTHEAMLRRFSKLPSTYFRLNVEQGMQEIELSEWEKLSNAEAHTTQYMRKEEVTEKLGSLVSAIRAPRGQLPLEQFVTPRPPNESVPQARERKRCPRPVQPFMGREEILDKMRKYFELGGDSRRVFVLHGLGGSGKTQIAFKFVQESTCFSDVFYIDATNEQTLRTDLEAITQGNTERSVDASLHWLASQREGNWLLFFDNADDVNLKLKKFLPQSGNILVTTRNPELRLLSAKDGDAKVGAMEHEDAKNLLLDRARAEESDENKVLAEAIVQTLKPSLQGNTERSVDASLHWLASQREGNWLLFFDNADDVNLKLKKFLPQSGNILVTTRNPELRLLSAKDGDAKVGAMEHEDAKNLLLDRARAEESDENKVLAEAIVQNNEFQGDDPYERAVYATWSLSYDKLDASARSLLQIFSLLNHEGISEEMFEKAASSEEQLEDSELQNKVTELLNELGKRGPDWSWDFKQVTKRLCSYSLIEYDAQNHTYSIHPLVQQWSRSTMDGNRQLMRKCVLSIIGLSISWTFDDKDYKYRCTLLQHISSSRVSVDPEQMASSVLSGLALVYSEQGQWNEAEALEVVVMEKRRQLLGDDHPDTLTSMANLAATYRSQGKWNEAEALEVVVMEKTKQLLRDDHPDTLTSMANLALTYSDQGKWNEAEALEVVVMEKRKQLLRDDHPDTLTSMANLAATYRSQGKWNEAEALQVVAMEKRKLLLRDDHDC
ncbi:hypothetical protein AGABI1DRAFT_108612 [Agaricus bisporus var. burnettii JB137-S8]|uniref:PNPLA domain-containing protein n=1 Tax=Agaricus bisporus var. burnettii (strain JB137-S8 / ATCC MYA-4627 / FGSC 10392) TaxID=597362 RepID=K5XPV6_AGABU|nr:uncharacterized protein AGABI1DRAFT_108612 [Agaricus bisporus var. burnettii JB137-S8]EKM76770.1 hypothetical protein AGABI1DRAFT_108612 [Agaricus bisporus var. burnettii JB137-S8]